MNFSNKIQKQFQEAGWFQGRNIKETYETNKFENFPQFLKDFLFEYGDLTVLDIKIYESDVKNQLEILPNLSFILTENDDSYDYIYDQLKEDLYIFAYFKNDNYHIGCDSNGKVYMIGDYCFLISDDLKNGIEKLLTDDWSKGYKQLNEETGKFE